MIRLLTISTALLLATSCGKQSPDQPNGTGDRQVNHAAEDEHGERRQLGYLDLFGSKFAVVQYGDVAAGEEAGFELEFESAEQRITTVRGWIGTEDAKGSMKSRWTIDDVANMHGHVEVPDPIPQGSKLWLELERGGESKTLSIAYR